MRAARRVRGYKASSTGPAFCARAPSPADLRSVALLRGRGDRAADRRSAGEGPFADPALDHIAIRAKKNRLATISGTKMI